MIHVLPCLVCNFSCILYDEAYTNVRLCPSRIRIPAMLYGV